MGRTDEELVEACQAGEASAFDGLVARWEDRIRGAAFRFLGSEEEARDVAQEAFLKAYRSLAGFKREARFSSWLYQIATNLCRDRLRRRKTRATVSLDEMEETGSVMVETGPGAQDRLLQMDLARTVRRAIESLPDEQREVVILKEYQDLTFLEIAQALDVPVSTVKTRLYRGLGQLRLRLEREGVRGAAPLPAPAP
ncbi:MAG TPA: sigma-70 family RNA polymerase sigma factor [Vicinamibacteria bacterium]|nr:sigma-70 family RNA polymerase sigma factor [Vicinamibacteria bacterium]